MRKILNVDGVNCNHCIDKIKKFISDCEGVEFIKIDLDAKTLEVEIDSESRLESVVEAVEDAGFLVK